MGSATYILTLEEAMALPADPLEEIVNGEIRKIPPPDKGHTRLLTVLARMLQKQLDESRYDVITTASGLGIRRDPTIAIRNPDLSIFETEDLVRDHQASGGAGYIWVAPKLIVECLSPSNRKGSQHQLLADYESAGAAEVWLLDPRKRSAEQHVLGEGLLRMVSSTSQGELRAAVLSVVVSIDQLWQVFATGRLQT